jgi:hypothetical protein
MAFKDPMHYISAFREITKGWRRMLSHLAAVDEEPLVKINRVCIATNERAAAISANKRGLLVSHEGIRGIPVWYAPMAMSTETDARGS